MKTRIVFTVLIVFGLFVFDAAYQNYAGPIEGNAAIEMVNAQYDSDYANQRLVTQDLIPNIVIGAGLISLLLIWISPIISLCTGKCPCSQPSQENDSNQINEKETK